jgi:acetyl-CoA carboxylase biotin carboxylase subunit
VVFAVTHPPPFSKVLVANRGEIAVRVIRACRELGVRTVAVYSEADATSPHVVLADEAVCLGPAEPAASYLNIPRLVEAARATGAEAVHPGYGFLAENPEFARACEEAGLVFVGPPADVIAALGDKDRARRLAEAAGVPVVPGHPAADDETLERAAQTLGFPVVLKAAAGGGGRGLRVVHGPAGFREALASARREVQLAFGDDAVLVEKYLEGPRHVEVQILADRYGAAVHLGERECSLQRRHQKILEEAPSPVVSPQLRARLGEAALRVARAAGYVNAGTVEFLLDRDGRFYFLEVNTRLQVEHPVTELVTGVDLVHAQLHIAAGRRLWLHQEDVVWRGHAVEARVYAEDPERDFAPSPGRVLLLREPHLPGVRVDSGIQDGQDIPVQYDPILAKVVAWGPDRPTALARLAQALHEYVLLGPKTNLGFLRDLVAHPAFREGDVSTGFVEQHFGAWRPAPPPVEVAALAAVLLAQTKPAPAAVPARAPDPWDRLDGVQLP